MKELIVLLGIMIFLMAGYGCTMCNEVWVKPRLTQEQLQQDNYLCRRYAQQIKWSIAYGGGTGAPYRDCMLSKGYYCDEK